MDLEDVTDDDEPIEIELGPNGELPPGPHFVDWSGLSFREFLAANGQDHPEPEDAPEVWAAWFPDAGATSRQLG
jgi:hypothetical protein